MVVDPAHAVEFTTDLIRKVQELAATSSKAVAQGAIDFEKISKQYGEFADNVAKFDKAVANGKK